MDGKSSKTAREKLLIISFQQKKMPSGSGRNFNEPSSAGGRRNWHRSVICAYKRHNAQKGQMMKLYTVCLVVVNVQ